MQIQAMCAAVMARWAKRDRRDRRDGRGKGKEEHARHRPNREAYGYGGAGMRAVKRDGEDATAYLPGMEMRRRRELAQRVTVSGLGYRCLRWLSGKPGTRGKDAGSGADSHGMRYMLADRLNSVTIELDALARLLTREAFYPGGGTAVWRVRHRAEASCKTVRHTGQERDATGLMYYGFRYYAPWLSRWTSADPAGTVDGLNVFAMARNNPATHRDHLGLAADDGRETLLTVMTAAALLLFAGLAAWLWRTRQPSLVEPPEADVARLAGMLGRHAGLQGAEAGRARLAQAKFVNARRAAYEAAGMLKAPQYREPLAVDWKLTAPGTPHTSRWRLTSPPSVAGTPEPHARRRRGGAQPVGADHALAVHRSD